MSFNKLLLYIFLSCLFYILVVELCLIDVYNPSLTLVRLGAILLKIAYSFVAATVFYLINVYIPKKRRWAKIAADIIFKTSVINNQISLLHMRTEIGENDIWDNNKIKSALSKIDEMSVESVYSDWSHHLFLLKLKLLDLINSLKAYNDLLSDDYLVLLVSIENYLLVANAFQGANRLNIRLVDEELSFQGIFIANKLLKDLKLDLERENKRLLDRQREKFRKKNYPK
jgi:hypothetical protein